MIPNAFIGPVLAVLVLLILFYLQRRVQSTQAHKVVQRVRLELQHIVDCLEPLAVVDEELNFIRVNEEFRDLIAMGYPLIIGKKVRDVMPFESNLIEAQVKQCFEKNKSEYNQIIEVPNLPITSEGRQRNYRLLFHEIELDHEPEQDPSRFVLILFQDITLQELTRQKNTEHEMRIREDFFKIHDMSRELEFHKRNLEEQMNERDRDLKIAKTIQEGLLPHQIEIPNVKVWASYCPVAFVGGDYYDLVPMGTDKYGIIIADVAGHGTPAAFVGALTKMALVHHAQQCESPAELLERLNSSLSQVIHTSHFVTAFFCVFDFKKQTLQYSRAGHPVPLLIRKNGDVHKLEARGLILGAFPTCMAVEETIDIQAGDRLFLFTDGCFERKPSSNPHDRLKYKDFIEELQRNSQAELGKILERSENGLVDRFNSLLPHDDDYTFLAIEFNGHNEETSR